MSNCLKVSGNQLCLFIYSIDCIVAKPFSFILHIYPYCDINLFVANFIYLYVVIITKLAIFVAKMSYIIVLVTTVYSLLELLVIIGLFDAI